MLASILISSLFFAAICDCKKVTSQEALEKMQSLREEHGNVISVNYETFKKYIKSKHSKYSVVAMFTALDPKYRCSVCEEARQEYLIVASSYAYMQSTSDIFFALVDYEHAEEAFATMGITTAPEFLYFPAGRNRKKKSDRLETMRVGYDAAPIARWLTEVSDVKIVIRRPIDYYKFIPAAIAVSIFVLLVIMKPRVFMRIAMSTTLWGLFILVIVFAMTSGQMWNFIRKPRDSGLNHMGEQELILSSDHAQFRYESYIIIALNAAISLGFILLGHAQEIKHHHFKKVVGFTGLCLVVVFFALLLSVFRMKNHGYPFQLIFN